MLTIALGLSVHRGLVPLPATPRDIAGDALWAMMIYWGLSAARPHAPWRSRAALALAVCWVVEASQLVHAPALDAFRATTIGHLVLGSGFDPRDLVAYALGVACAAWLDARYITGARADSGM